MRKLALLAVTMICAACGAPSAEARADLAADMATGPAHAALQLTPEVQVGRTIYETVCWTCHGQTGRGDGPAVQDGSVDAPPSFLNDDYLAMATERLGQRLNAGPAQEVATSPYPHMEYVAGLIEPERFPLALTFVQALAYPPEIPGSLLAGEELYSRRCVACHGADGRGVETSSEFLNWVKPADFRTDTLVAARDWDGIFTRIRDGGRALHRSSMPPWRVVFSDDETWDLVAYVASFQPGLLSEPNWTH